MKANNAQRASRKVMLMSPAKLRYERAKQDRRRAAQDSHGDAWTGMSAAMENPDRVSRQVAAEIARWQREKEEQHVG